MCVGSLASGESNSISKPSSGPCFVDLTGRYREDGLLGFIHIGKVPGPTIHR